jgi:hypothetical protein
MVRRFLAVMVLMLAAAGVVPASSDKNPSTGQPMSSSEFNYPKVPANHQHMRLLLDNAFHYLNPAHGIVEPLSGYPAEGWNQEPGNGLFLRSFTQLTAIGTWVELLANVAAGYADNPYISKESALNGLARAITTLLEDQRNPALAAQGLLVNFLGLEGGNRVGPLLESIERRRFIETFGDQQSAAIWLALLEKGWLQEVDNGRQGNIRRGERYGANHFDGVLAPYAKEPLQSSIMGLLDQRVRTIIFGDNANLTAALARSEGALLRTEIRHDPKVAALREQIERFIEGQKEGYTHLFDPKTATFVFGWDATADRFVGWDDGRGNWVTGQMNYFINEFRGPWTFTVLRYGLPVAAIRNAGFKIKPYRLGDGRDTYALAAWEGSAFQLLGLSQFMQEFKNQGWRSSNENLVEIELDYSGRGGLPGLLSEAYSGNGTEYTGDIGIPELAVAQKSLNTRAPSLYSLGVAYSIAPDKVDSFLQDHWSVIAGMLTPHGPWEGWNIATRSVIPFQTTVHTLSLILGGINSAQENMHRYLKDRQLYGQLEDLYKPGDRANLLVAENQVVPWTSDQSRFAFSRDHLACRFSAQLNGNGGVAFIAPAGRTLNLSNGRLVIHYRSESEVKDATIAFKRAKDDPLPPPAFPVEVFARFKQAPDDLIEIVLPATPALSGIKEVSLAFGNGSRQTPVDVTIRAFDFMPFTYALETQR